MDARKCAYHGPDGKLVMDQDRETCHEMADTKLLDRIHWQLRHQREHPERWRKPKSETMTLG